MKKPSRWTKAKVALLIELWPVLSCTKIAARLGKGFTRNMVAGKAWRLELPAKAMGGGEMSPNMKAALEAVLHRRVGTATAAAYFNVNPGSLRTSVWRTKQRLRPLYGGGNQARLPH